MSYTINGKVYTDHPLMDEIVYNTKIILKQITIKNSEDADNNETSSSIALGDNYVAAVSGTFTFESFPFTTELLQDYRSYVTSNITDTTLKTNILNEFTDGAIADYIDPIKRDECPENVLDSNGDKYQLRVEVTNFCNKKLISDYVEENNYYRILHGLPEYNTTAYDIYVDSSDSRFADKDNTADIDFTIPLHKYNNDQINALDELGILSDIKETYTGDHYKYINHLGGDSIDFYTARVASNWDILSMPGVNQLVKDRFKELYRINRDIYYKRTYQTAYKFESDYYDEIVIILILCQTYTDMIVDTPEWYVRRDVIDLRTAQYFLESNGIKFFKNIPLKYQTALVKNINKLIRYKSTSKNIEDIINIFNLSGVDVYKYYLYRKFLYRKTTENTDINYKDWEMSDVIGAQWFGSEDISSAENDAAEVSDTKKDPTSNLYWNGVQFVADTDNLHKDENPYCALADSPIYIDRSLNNETRKQNVDNTLFDFGLEEDSEEEDTKIDVYIYDFGNFDSSQVEDSDTTDEGIEHKEAVKTVTDSYDNVYDLEFVRVPLEDSYADYISDDLHRVDYDNLTYDDEYWDGEDVHHLVKNRILSACDSGTGYEFVTQGTTVKNRDFTVKGTKYMSLTYQVNLKTYMMQMSYFLGLLANSNVDTNDIMITVPSIKSNSKFKLSNLLLLLYALSEIYLGKTGYINTPSTTGRTDKKPSFSPYNEYNGGRPWNGSDPIVDPVVPDPEWSMTSDDEGPYDYGDESNDTETKYIDLNLSSPIRHSFVNDTYYDYGYEKGGADLIPSGSIVHIYDFEAINPFTPSGTITVNPTNDGWMIGNNYDFGSDNPYYAPPTSNWTFDSDDYDFQDEENRTEYDIGVNTRYYDFLDEDFDYIFTSVPETPPAEEDHYWDNLEKGSFTDTLEGGHVEYYKDANGNIITLDKLEPGGVYTSVIPANNYRREINGGDKRYAKVTQDTFYDWMRTDNPDLFIPTTGRIYGFNMLIDTQSIAKRIGIRHSRFEFKKGYSLSDLGIDSFISKIKIESIDELMSIYNTDLACLDKLMNLMKNPASRDEMVTYNYAFNMLFTKPFDYKYYTGANGSIYDTYLDMLKDKDFTLYKYYKTIIAEPNEETRKDNIRNAINDIGETLDYYLSGENTQYVMSFLPTQTVDAVLGYINLVVNFLKSWKVYFLSPVVEYSVGNSLDDKTTGTGDMVSELKRDIWQDDRDGQRDNVSYMSISNISELDASSQKEIIDLKAYHLTDIDDLYIDGGQIKTATSVSATKLASNIVGANSSDEDKEVDGGDIGKSESCAPYTEINGGNVASGKSIYDLDGGGPLQMQEYLDLDGGLVTDPKDLLPVLPDFSIPINNIDGGYVSCYYRSNKDIIVIINKDKISMNFRLSPYESNQLKITKSGLYLQDLYASSYDFNQLRDLIYASINTYISQIGNLQEEANIIADPNKLDAKITKLLLEQIGNALTAYSMIKNKTVNKNLVNASGECGTELRQWYINTCPFGWGNF